MANRVTYPAANPVFEKVLPPTGSSGCQYPGYLLYICSDTPCQDNDPATIFYTSKTDSPGLAPYINCAVKVLIASTTYCVKWVIPGSPESSTNIGPVRVEQLLDNCQPCWNTRIAYLPCNNRYSTDTAPYYIDPTNTPYYTNEFPTPEECLHLGNSVVTTDGKCYSITLVDPTGKTISARPAVIPGYYQNCIDCAPHYLFSLCCAGNLCPPCSALPALAIPEPWFNLEHFIGRMCIRIKVDGQCLASYNLLRKTTHGTDGFTQPPLTGLQVAFKDSYYAFSAAEALSLSSVKCKPDNGAFSDPEACNNQYTLTPCYTGSDKYMCGHITKKGDGTYPIVRLDDGKCYHVHEGIPSDKNSTHYCYSAKDTCEDCGCLIYQLQPCNCDDVIYSSDPGLCDLVGKVILDSGQQKCYTVSQVANTGQTLSGIGGYEVVDDCNSIGCKIYYVSECGGCYDQNNPRRAFATMQVLESVVGKVIRSAGKCWQVLGNPVSPPCPKKTNLSIYPSYDECSTNILQDLIDGKTICYGCACCNFSANSEGSLDATYTYPCSSYYGDGVSTWVYTLNLQRHNREGDLQNSVCGWAMVGVQHITSCTGQTTSQDADFLGYTFIGVTSTGARYWASDCTGGATCLPGMNPDGSIDDDPPGVVPGDCSGGSVNYSRYEDSPGYPSPPQPIYMGHTSITISMSEDGGGA